MKRRSGAERRSTRSGERVAAGDPLSGSLALGRLTPEATVPEAYATRSAPSAGRRA
ncbi:hypothetical protein DFR74_102246 [Nocardia puris]|uniref:Uncharacterized protein n=1 Tax=Nocardia puris TaxID=208602 RepID=A0A366DUR3_9NOCA|nr:hypothetical protein DFR74_102246 [Nocardia puris]